MGIADWDGVLLPRTALDVASYFCFAKGKDTTKGGPARELYYPKELQPGSSE